MNVAEAKGQLSHLVAQAEQGHEVVIARAGTPVVRLVPIITRRHLGVF
ncbi:MAG: type II toxin-antitoxin system prevent-host-death family antitoxin, partial [Micrococcales bacterium]|nr:type II toxin-antitoxin system prevent-host-death family antitoxin [Micrococcales bacterium]